MSQQQVIVSLTSFPPAISYAARAVQSILNGSVLPDKVVLYLTFAEFGEKGIPKDLQELAKNNPRFEIRDYPINIRSYRKLVPALTDFPDAIIVLLTPLQTIKVDKSIIGFVGDLIESVGTGLGCYVIRQDIEGCVRSDEESEVKVNTYDGTHTSEQGARLNGEMIACKVCEFICERNKICE